MLPPTSAAGQSPGASKRSGTVPGRRRGLASSPLAALAALVLGVGGLAACSGRSGSGGTDATGAAASCGKQGAEGSLKGPATISVAYSSTQEFNANYQVADFFSALKKDFQAAHPGVTVKLVPIGGSYSNFEEKVQLMLRSPATTADVIHEWTQQVGGQVEAGQLAPLEGYLKSWPDWKQFPDSVRLGGVPGPQTWQMVSGINDFGLYYNVNQFRKAGLPVPWQPKTWAQVIAAAKTIKQKVPGTTPLWLYAGNQLFDQTTRENFLPLLQGTGSPVAQGFKWVVQSKGLLDTFSFYHTVFADGLGPSASVLANPSADGTVNGTLMPRQKVAIGLVGNWVASWWTKGGPSPWPGGVKAYRVAALPTQNGQAPGFATQATGSTFVLTCASAHRRLAVELMEMAENKSFNTKHVIWTGEVPPRNDVLHSAAYLNSVPYFNGAENSWMKYATFSPSYNYSPYATCVGQVTGNIAASGLSGAAAAQQFKQCASRGIGAGGFKSLTG